MDQTTNPFFIIGCTRSGTTLLRNLLRLHPNLNAPEETFFYRWGEPYGSDGYRHVYLNNPTIKHHQSLDGIVPEHADAMLAQSSSRRELSVRYGRAFLRRTQRGDRWFDKTPQNIYGVLLIRAQFPTSKIIHIHRHPLNVVASLRTGKVMPKQSLVAAVNYWVEAMQIIGVYRQLPNNNLIELAYEELVTAPIITMGELLDHLGEDVSQYDFSKIITPTKAKSEPELGDIYVEPDRSKYQEILTSDEIDFVLKYCAPYMEQFGYKDLRMVES
ncbi:MAG: sulfotransferase [Trueperaceae bacterium]|nr:sulfotransferase [Trueperaceae bacterium]